MGRNLSRILCAPPAYFDYINDTEGGVHGRKIKFLLEDDAYSPPKTVDVTRRLVEQDKIFAMVNGMGSQTHRQVVNYLQDQGIPDLFVATGSTQWVDDPEASPTVFGGTWSYTSEGIVLGQYISVTYPGKKLGLIFENNDFGIDGIDGVKRGVGNSLEIVGEESYEVVDTDLNAQIDRLRAAGSEVIAAWATPVVLSTAIKHARLDLEWDVPFVISGVSANEFTILLAGPVAAEGIVSHIPLRQAYETSDPGLVKHLEIIRKYAGIEAANVLTIYGQFVGELTVEALKEAGPNLDREGLVNGAESISNFVCSLCLFPVSFSATDHDAGQATILGRVEGGKWVRFGDGISYEGTSLATMTAADLRKVPAPD